MNISGASTAAYAAAPAAVQASPAIVALQAGMQAQTDLVETLLAVGIDQQLAASKMQIIGQIIDTYA